MSSWHKHIAGGEFWARRTSRKNWQAIRKAGNATLVAVASRERGRAASFIADCQASAPFPVAPTACGSYQELLARDDIDALYIPLPTGLRKEWVIKAAQAGKHILAEKPAGVRSADVRDMLEACRAHGVQFMDGVMFMHGERLRRMRQVLDDQESVGEILRITSAFSFRASDEFLATNIRVREELEPLGCLGDLGWYNIRFSLWAMKEQLPACVTGRILSTARGQDVPLEFAGELFFPDGGTASFFCSFRAWNQQWAHVSGTKGFLQLPDFVLPYYGNETGFEVNAPALHVDGCDFNMETHARRTAVKEYSNSSASAQEARMIQTFGAIAMTGKLDTTWGENALRTQEVLDACLNSARRDGLVVTL